MKQIQIRIFPNGDIKAETHGVKGKNVWTISKRSKGSPMP